MPNLDMRAPMHHAFAPPYYVHNAVIFDNIHAREIYARDKLSMPSRNSRKVQQVVRIRAMQAFLVRRWVNA
ncbi:MAG: hypothetical protein M3Z96_11200, partial [Pseudomonadota bacterium]|nr:hypothetical protein [Pseudomonadota bacterium]